MQVYILHNYLTCISQFKLERDAIEVHTLSNICRTNDNRLSIVMYFTFMLIIRLDYSFEIARALTGSDNAKTKALLLGSQSRSGVLTISDRHPDIGPSLAVETRD